MRIRFASRRKPQKISEKTWRSVEAAVCAGMGYTEAAKRFGIRSPHAIIMRARRNRWPVPSRIKERTRALQLSVKARAEANEEQRDCNEKSIEALAESWQERGEQHRIAAFRAAHNAFLKACLPAPETWRELELADRIARRAAGLDSQDGRDPQKMVLNIALLGGGLPDSVKGNYILPDERPTMDALELPED